MSIAARKIPLSEQQWYYDPDSVSDGRINECHLAIERSNIEELKKHFHEREIPLAKFYNIRISQLPLAVDTQHIIISYLGVYEPLLATQSTTIFNKNGTVQFRRLTSLQLAQQKCDPTGPAAKRAEQIWEHLLSVAQEDALLQLREYNENTPSPPQYVVQKNVFISDRLLRLGLDPAEVHYKIQYKKLDQAYESDTRKHPSTVLSALYNLVAKAQTATPAVQPIITQLFMEKIDYDKKIFAPIVTIADAKLLKEIIDLLPYLHPHIALKSRKKILEDFYLGVERELEEGCRKRRRADSLPLDKEESGKMGMDSPEFVAFQKQRPQLEAMLKANLAMSMFLLYQLQQLPPFQLK